MNETNAELEEMNTIEARDEAYERARNTMPIDEFAEPAYDLDEWDNRIPDEAWDAWKMP